MSTAPEYPHGKKYHDDQGALEMRIAADHQAGVVRLDYRKPVEWIALEPEEAVEFAHRIIVKAGAIVDRQRLQRLVGSRKRLDR